MPFQNRDEFISAQASEKIVLAHVHAKNRLVVWLDEGGGVYSKVVDHFVYEMKMFDTELTRVSDLGSVTTGTFYYSPQIGKVYIQNPASENPADEEMIVTFRLFFSTVTVDQTWDFANDSSKVSYQGRVIKAPEYKHKIGIDQKLVSLVGKGSLILNNNDGYFDEIYDQLIFENQTISIYSWNRDLQADQAKIIFKGKVTNKNYGSDKVTFIVKDSIFDLAQNVPQNVYDETDNVSDSVNGTYKRWVYGRVDGLKIQSVDQIADGYTIPGTVSSVLGVKELTKFSDFPGSSGNDYLNRYFLMSTAKNQENIYYWYGTSGGGTDPGPISGYPESRKIIITLGDSVADVIQKTKDAMETKFDIIDVDTFSFYAENEEFGESTNSSTGTSGIPIQTLRQGVTAELVVGTSTSFLSDVSPNDLVTIGTQEFTIDKVIDDNQLWVSNIPTYQFNNEVVTLNPEIPTTVKNREFFVADHECTELTKTLISVNQLNRVQLSDTDGLVEGDFLEFNTSERIEIRAVNPGNVVLLRQNITITPTIGSDVIRPPVQFIYIEGVKVDPSDFTLTNSTDLKVTLDSDIEFNLTPILAVSDSLTFTNGSRTIMGTGSVNLIDILSPRDWIQPSLGEFSTYYEILSVEQDEITIRTVFTDPTVSTTGVYKSPSYIGDDTIVSTNVLGKTVDGTKAGLWISTAAQAIKDSLNSIGITQVNEDSFLSGTTHSSQVVSMPLPLRQGDSGITVKTVIDNLCNSVQGSITLDNDLNIKYNSLLVVIEDDIPIITDKDLIKWNVRAVNGNIYGRSIVNFRHKDIDRNTLEEGANVVTVTSDFVKNYVGTEKTNEIDLRLYSQSDALIRAHREVYHNRLSRAEITLESDLRLDTYEIGDKVKLDIRRLYKRMGDNLTTDKVAVIIGKEVNGQQVTLVLSDLGNIFNSSSIITPNTAPEFSLSSSDEKIKYGYITTAAGIVDDDEDTVNIHLIS